MTHQRGFRTGFIVLGILLIGANLRAGLTVVGPLVTEVQASTGMSAAAAANLVTIPVLCFAIVSPVAPWFSQKLGLERSLAAALVVIGGGIILRSLTGGIWPGTILLGLGAGVLNVLIPALVRRDVPHKISQVTSWYQVTQTVAAGLAASIAVPVAGMSRAGWQFAFGITAALVVIALAVFWPFVSHPKKVETVRTETGSIPLRGKNPWKTAVGWQIALFMGLQSSMFYTAITWFPTLEASLGVDPTHAGLHQGLFQLAGVAGSLAGGAFFARSQPGQVIPMAVMAPSGLVSIIGLLLFPGWSLVWIFIAGLACGTFIVMAISLMALRSQDHEQTARVSGMSQSIGYLLAAIVPIAFGALYDVTGGWTASLLLLAAVQVGMAIAGLLAARDRQI